MEEMSGTPVGVGAQDTCIVSGESAVKAWRVVFSGGNGLRRSDQKTHRDKMRVKIPYRKGLPLSIHRKRHVGEHVKLMKFLNQRPFVDTMDGVSAVEVQDECR